VRAAAGQVAGVLALGVQRVGGDDCPADGDAVQQGGEQGVE
jgi:hypothetical protein